jgi:hypothetical protein
VGHFWVIKMDQFFSCRFEILIMTRGKAAALKPSEMITGNLTFSRRQQIFKDPMVMAVAVDRLVHHSVIL